MADARKCQFIADAKQWAMDNGGDQHDGYDEFWIWMTDDRLVGTDAKTYFANKKAESEKWLDTGKPVHTGNLDLVEGKV